MNILLLTLYLLIFLLITYRINKKRAIELPKFSLPLFFLLKLGFAGIFIYVYTYIYGNGTLVEDAGRFFHDSKILYGVFHQSPKAFFEIFFGLNANLDFYYQYLGETTRWVGVDHFLINDTRNIIRINTLLQFISNGNLYIHFAFFTFLSFLGITDLYFWVKKKSSLPPLLLFSLLLLTPNLAFWSSSILKEPILILGICLFLRGLFDDLTFGKRSWRLIIGGILMIAFKPYVLVSLIIAYIFYHTVSKLLKNQWLNLGIYSVGGFLLILLSGYSQYITYIVSDKQKAFINVSNGGLYLDGTPEEYYYIELENRDKFLINTELNSAVQLEKTEAFTMNKSENFKRKPFELEEINREFPIYLDLEGAESKIPITLIDNNFWQMIKNIPEALFNSFFQPLPQKNMGSMQIVSFLENVFFVLLLVLLLLFPKPTEAKTKRVLASLFLFSILTGIVIGWTTPVAGAIVRYIIPAKIMLLVIFSMQFDFQKFYRRKRRNGE